MNRVIERMTEAEGTGARRMVLLRNADGKEWLMPRRRMRTAMALYQPGSRRGKQLKRLLPALHRLPGVLRAVHAETLTCRLSDSLQEQLKSIFGVARPDFAIFGGTPCVHQKVTMQLSVGSRILGYAKLTDSAAIAALMRRESDFLQLLAEKGVRGVPESLWCGETTDGLHMFVQSTEKTRRSRSLHSFTPLHTDFLNRLREKTRQEMPFEQTDFFRSLTDLRSHLDWLPPMPFNSAVKQRLDEVIAAHAEETMEVCACHSDFTPWNMTVADGRLFVFDWEYARLTCPPGLDRCHYFTQSAIFERRMGAAEIMAYVDGKEGAWIDRRTYTMYLLDVLSRFTMREKGRPGPDVAHAMAVWAELVQRLAEK